MTKNHNVQSSGEGAAVKSSSGEAELLLQLPRTNKRFTESKEGRSTLWFV